MNPRLVICIGAFEYGGQGTFVELELIAQQEHFDITLVTSRLTRPVPNGIKVFVLSPGSWLTLSGYKGLQACLRDADVIHCHDSLGYMMAAYLSGRPWVVTSHGICPVRYRGSLNSMIKGLITEIVYPILYRKASLVIASTEYLSSWIRRRAHVHPIVIGRGVSEVNKHPAPISKQFSLLYVGEISRRKGVSYLLKALSRLPQSVSITFVGLGDLQKYQDLAFRLQISDRVTFCGVVDVDELNLLYRQSHAVVSASYWEGYGLPVLEGFSFGRPAIVRATGGMKEVVESSKAGLCFSNLKELETAVMLIERDWPIYSSAAVAYVSELPWRTIFEAYRKALVGCIS